MHFYINFRISLSTSSEKLDGIFYWNFTELIDKFGNNWHLKNTESSDPYTY